MRKKLFAVIMSVMMMVTFMPAMAFAAETHAGHHVTAEVTSWAADYSKANVSIYCKDDKGATIASTSVDTKRMFKEEIGGIWVTAEKSTITTAVEARVLALYGGNVTVDEVTVDKDAGVTYDGRTTIDTLYYDFTNAQLVDNGKALIEDMTADEYLDLYYLDSTKSYKIRFEEPSTVDSFDKKAKYGYIDLVAANRYGTSAKHDKETISATGDSVKKDKNEDTFGYFWMDLYSLAKREVAETYEINAVKDSSPDVRVDMEFPEYTPYQDNVVLNLPVQFRAYSHIEPIHVVGLTTDKTQKIKINTTDGLMLNHQILSAKGDASSAAVKKVLVADTEKEALRLGMMELKYNGDKYPNYNNILNVYYVGEDQNFEVVTQNVSVQYGTIDDLGNVTYSATAPEVVNVKYEQDGYYHDTNYHFIIKITKGNKTVYMPVVIDVNHVDVEFNFKAKQFYAGVEEELNVSDLVEMNIDAAKKYTFANDKANLDKFFNEYVTIHNLDTSRRHSVKIGIDSSKWNNLTYKQQIAAFDEQFVNNFDFDNDSVSEADLYVTDQANQIKFSNRTRSFHVKNSAKLNSTKKFQLKATANYGKVTFKKITGKYNKIKVSKTGKVTVKKGLKKGTYNVKVKAFAPCKEVTRTIKIKVRY